MNIERMETFLVPPRWLFVRIESQGLVGWGEASLEGHAEAVAGALEALCDRFIGADATRIEDIWQQGYRGGFYRGGAVLMSALSGLDQALWDLNGKALGVPVWRLLGGRVRDRVRAYAWIGGDRPSEIGEAAGARRAQGFAAVKMNATAEIGMLESPRSLDGVVERLAAAQAHGLDVGIDFHGRLRRPMARQLVRLLEPLRPLFVEEPLLSENLEGLAELKASTSIPIALGERLYSRWDFKPIFEKGLADIVQPDLSHAGGISEVRRIAAMAEASDIAVAPHCPLGPLALAACLQIAACTPNHVLQEMSLGIHYQGLGDLTAFVANPEVLSLEDGYLPIPADPGLGLTIDEEKVRDAAKAPHRWRNPIWRQSDGGLAEW
ncbi:MAG TPA: galactonate dehydratase [Caulobacteraceae bacterium]